LKRIFYIIFEVFLLIRRYLGSVHRLEHHKIFKIPLAGLLVLIGLMLPLQAQAQGEGQWFRIQAFEFRGIEQIDKHDLLDAMAVKAPPSWKFWANQPVASPQELQNDAIRIRQFYQDQGFYLVNVTYEIISADLLRFFRYIYDVEEILDLFRFDAPRDEAAIRDARVIFRIVEGEPVTIGQIDLDYRHDIEAVTPPRLAEILPVQPGRLFKRQAYEDSKDVIRNVLGREGYPFARVRGSAVVDQNRMEADIAYEIEPGPRCYFGEIHITGHEDYVYRQVIERALRFRPGEQFNAEKLDDSRLNLFSLNVFATALITMGELDPQTNTVPVHVRVRPRNQHGVRLGVGYGTEDRLRLQGAWSYRNLTGRADRLTMLARRSDIRENIKGEYRVPFFLGHRNDLIAEAGLEREKEVFYTLRKVFTEVNVNRRIDPVWFSNIGYNLEINRLDDIETGFEPDPNASEQEDYRVSAVRLDIGYHSLDDDLHPTSGRSLLLSVENAMKYLASEIDYIKPMADARIYFPIAGQMVVAGRVRIRTIETIRDTEYIPINKRLFLGGSKSVRGYDYQQLPVVDGNDVAIGVGGLTSLDGNIELRYPLYRDFKGVGFLDMGVLDRRSYKLDMSRMRYTCGIGLRYDTLLGPIQLDVGYKLNPPRISEAKIPGLKPYVDTDRWGIHFNIGHAF
jgi:outer membrane protein assembly complex protein YaeT